MDNEIKLYNLLVDQLLKYESTIWQIPTALVIGNFLAIEKFLCNPVALSCLALFNLGIIFVFQRMIKAQRVIIHATQNAEGQLRNEFNNFIPNFQEHKIKAPIVFLTILWILELILIIYTICIL